MPNINGLYPTSVLVVGYCNGACCPECHIRIRNPQIAARGVRLSNDLKQFDKDQWPLLLTSMLAKGAPGVSRIADPITQRTTFRVQWYVTTKTIYDWTLIKQGKINVVFDFNNILPGRSCWLNIVLTETTNKLLKAVITFVIEVCKPHHSFAECLKFEIWGFNTLDEPLNEFSCGYK